MNTTCASLLSGCGTIRHTYVPRTIPVEIYVRHKRTCYDRGVVSGAARPYSPKMPRKSVPQSGSALPPCTSRSGAANNSRRAALAASSDHQWCEELGLNYALTKQRLAQVAQWATRIVEFPEEF